MATNFNLDVTGSITCHAWNKDNTRKFSTSFSTLKISLIKFFFFIVIRNCTIAKLEGCYYFQKDRINMVKVSDTHRTFV